MANGNGWNIPTWAAIVGMFASIVAPLLGIIYWRQQKDVSGLKGEVKKLWIEATEFKKFQAFDAERLKHWERWREDLVRHVESLERRIAEIKQEHIDWKHDKYGKRVAKIELSIMRIKDKLGMPDHGDGE